MEEKDKIKAVATRRKIGRLLHFTRVENLPSIFEKGLLPQCDSPSGTEFNNIRDGNTESICLSISHVSNMFYPMRKNNPQTAWCVLVFSSEILWEKECKFTPINAVSNILKGKPEEKFYGAAALEAMFDPKVTNPQKGITTRKNWHQDNMVTNPQAEIRVKGAISMDYLTEVHFKEKSDFAGLKRPENVEFIKTAGFFDTLNRLMQGHSKEGYLKWLNDPFS